MASANGGHENGSLLRKDDENAEPLSLATFGGDNTGHFGIIVLVWQAVMIGLFCIADVGVSPMPFKDSSYVEYYNMYLGVALMMFVGFGYLMTFLKDYGLGAVGLTMFVTCFGVQWSLIVENMLEGTYGEGLPVFTIGMTELLHANFAVAAELISFGGLIGKVSPTQLAVLTILEPLFYCLNKVFYDWALPSFEDPGGTIIIHVFGAYFGLAACAGLGPAGNTDRAKSSYVSDIFSLVGTVFLWLYWPSFVAGDTEPGTDEHKVALVNTVIALLGSTVVTFGLTPFLMDKKLFAVSVQNATLAGGVSIGATATINMRPVGALVIGCLAGAISCGGFCKAPEWMAKYDTCGINNLHGMPGLFGGLVSIFMPLFVASATSSPLPQLAGLFGTLLVAVVTGFVTGAILKRVKSPVAAYSDAAFWTEVEVEAVKGE